MNESLNDADVMAALVAPFPQLKQCPGKGSTTTYYADSSMCMNRLDDSVGPDKWEDRYIQKGQFIHCILRVTLPSGRTLRRTGSSAFVWLDKKGKELAPPFVIKSAFSDAFKRACKAFGVGRYINNREAHDGGLPNYYARHAARVAALLHANRPGPEDRPGPPPKRAPRDLGEPELAGTREPAAPPTPRENPSRTPAAVRVGLRLFKKYKNPPYGDWYITWLVNYGIDHDFPARMGDWTEPQCLEAANAMHHHVREHAPGVA